MSRAERTPTCKESPEVDCAQLAAVQHGVISRQQAFQLGLSKSTIYRRVDSGGWVVVLPGVYRLTSVPTSWRQRLMAACVWSEGFASHRSAAALGGLDGFPPGPIEVSTTRKINSRAGVIVHRVDQLPAHKVTVLDGIPVTTPTSTLLDLGAVVDPTKVEFALEDALRKGLTSLPRLRWELREAGGRGRRGTGILRSLLAERPPGYAPTESSMEVRLLRLIKKARLPAPEAQFVIKDQGKFVARPDFAYPMALLAIEAQSYRYHSGRRVWHKDLARQNRLTRLGWRIIHVTYEDLRSRPAEVIAAIRHALGAEPYM